MVVAPHDHDDDDDDDHHVHDHDDASSLTLNGMPLQLSFLVSGSTEFDVYGLSLQKSAPAPALFLVRLWQKRREHECVLIIC